MVIRNPRRDGVIGSRCASGGAQALSYLRTIPGAKAVMFWNGPLLVMLRRSDLELTAYLCSLRRMAGAGPDAWVAFHEVFCRPGMEAVSPAPFVAIWPWFRPFSNIAFNRVTCPRTHFQE